MLGALNVRNLAIVAAVVMLALAGVFAFDLARGRSAPQARAPVEDAAVDEVTIDDPIAPGRPLRIVGERAAGDGIGAPAGGDESWVSAQPDERWRYSKSADARGVDPCDAPDPGFSGFSSWKPLGGGVLYLVPDKGGIDARGRFDLVVHFHGHDMARKGFIEARAPLVLVAMSDNDYRTRLAGDAGLDHLLLAIESKLSEGRDGPAKVERVAVTSWSGGYGAVNEVLQSDAERVDAVALLDGLHGSRTPEKLELMLAPFARYAKRAANGEAFMLVTHSSIDPGTYASTTETANHLIHAVGGRPLAVAREDALGLELISAFSQRDFHVRGYAGGDKPDHCAHLALMKDATLAIASRWRRR